MSQNRSGLKKVAINNYLDLSNNCLTPAPMEQISFIA